MMIIIALMEDEDKNNSGDDHDDDHDDEEDAADEEEEEEEDAIRYAICETAYDLRSIYSIHMKKITYLEFARWVFRHPSSKFQHMTYVITS